jgi:hypothetical protein
VGSTSKEFEESKLAGRDFGFGIKILLATEGFLKEWKRPECFSQRDLAIRIRIRDCERRKYVRMLRNMLMLM